MNNRWKQLKERLIRLATSWYVLGLLGWILLALNYPLETVLPRYAG